MTYICKYFSKTEDQCSQAKKQAAKEAFENSMHHHDTGKKIAILYLTLVQETVHHILPKLNLKRIFPTVYFVNTNLPEERFRVITIWKRTEQATRRPPRYFQEIQYWSLYKKTKCNVLQWKIKRINWLLLCRILSLLQT